MVILDDDWGGLFSVADLFYSSSLHLNKKTEAAKLVRCFNFTFEIPQNLISSKLYIKCHTSVRLQKLVQTKPLAKGGT